MARNVSEVDGFHRFPLLLASLNFFLSCENNLSLITSWISSEQVFLFALVLRATAQDAPSAVEYALRFD